MFKLIICLLTEQNNICIDVIGLDHINLHTFIRESKKCKVWKYTKKEKKKERNKTDTDTIARQTTPKHHTQKK